MERFIKPSVHALSRRINQMHNDFTALSNKEMLINLKKHLNRMEWKIDRSFQGIMQSVDELGDDLMSALTDALDFAEQTASEDTAADESAKALLITLSDMVKALGNGVNDPALVARITALGDGIKSRAASLAAAVVANTPAATPPIEPSTGI
jgi:hypothetical protein